jgi:hypothetical protein
MTRLKKLAIGGAAAALIMTGAVSKSFAIEAGDFQYLAGASIGIPGGAAAPPGVYTGFESAFGLYGGMTGNQGGTLPGSQTAHGIGLGAFIGIVPVVWSTGWNFLGASYSVAVIQPFVTAFAGEGGGLPVPGLINANTTCSSLAGSFCAWQQMFINTVFQPLNLSWNLGGGWFTSVAFSFQAPDGTKVSGTANPDFWTFTPGAAISYLSASWTLSANLAYNIYTASQGFTGTIACQPACTPATFANGYVDGNQFVGDLTALYKLGKWSFGPVGYFVWQTTADRAGGTGCAGMVAAGSPFACANQNFVGVGGLVGYDFGPVDVQVWATDTVASINTAEAGWTIWSRVGFRLWAPEAPKPLVAKN